MKIVIAGASGLIGGALVPALRAAGHEVQRLVRRKAVSTDEIAWDPERGDIDSSRLTGTDAAINLSGENVGAGRWTAARREEILRSRVECTRTLVGALTKLRPVPHTLISASAIGCYGDRAEEVLTEASEFGRGFLPEVCQAWEAEAHAAERAGIRVVVTRFGVVLARNGGALAKMLPIFRLGLGGRLGDGAQWMSWISIDDVVGAIVHALANPQLAGPLNVVAPEPVRNMRFTSALAAVLRRPAIIPAPRWALRLAVGRGMADEALLASTRVAPERLLESGYRFRHPTLEPALHALEL